VNLAIIGTGLVSPIGLTPLQHACFPRAGIGLHPASAFVGGDGEPVSAFHCPWLGAKLPVAERLAALGERALQTATVVLEGIPQLAPKEQALFVCLGAPRPGLTEADRQGAVGALAAAAKAPLRRVFTGAASFFAALGAAEHLLDAGEVRVAVIVAVDSFVSLEAVRAELEAAPATWVREPPPPSEAAVALAVMKGAEGRELALSLGTIHYAGTLQGQGSDDDDDIVDGAALAGLLEQVPVLAGPIVRAYGQDQVDRLRQTEWTCAAARNAARFHPLLTTASIERWTGRVGGAAGAAQLVFALGAEQHHALHEAPAGAGPFVAWAISRDGTRGLCAATAAGA
jgi:hypothetical protein